VRNTFSLSVFNDWSMAWDPPIDSLRLSFSYPGGYGSWSVSTKDTTLYTDSKLPATIPMAERFEAGRSIYIAVEEVQPYKAFVLQIDHLFGPAVASPAPALGLELVGNEIQFTFTGDPTLNYSVESSDSLFSESWTAVKTIAGIAAGFSVPKDPGGAQKFYRLRQIRCECLP
jgi:hypothetical protein